MVKKIVVSYFLLTSFVHALTVRPVNIEELTERSGRIVYGKILVVTPHLGTTGKPAHVSVRVQVEQTFKGPSEKEFEFNQIASLDPHRKGMFSDLPKYFSGERVVLFLRAPNEIGLSSPIGLAQGIFNVIGKDSTVDPQVVSRMKNGFLFQNLKTARVRAASENLRPESLKLSDLKKLIQQTLGVK